MLSINPYLAANRLSRNHQYHVMLRPVPKANQSGVILLIALIALVAMTMAAIAMVRSVDTTNVIAGNLAFQQSATHSGDIGTEKAILWLEANNKNLILRVDNLAEGYAATWNPAEGFDWQTLVINTGVLPKVVDMDENTGNSVEYIIQRMCALQGLSNPPLAPATGCAVPASVPQPPIEAGQLPTWPPRQLYYRITSKITGPRNTVSYTQTIVAL